MSITCEMLLHPELLSNEQLMLIISERQLKIPNMHQLPRHELLDLFHRFCLPYGQRKYRDSGRGKILNKSRHLSPESPNKLNTFRTSYCKSNPTCDRVKPPPDLLTGHMKRIKLDTVLAPVKKDLTNNIKRKMSIDMTTPAIDSTPPKREKKPITWP